MTSFLFIIIIIITIILVLSECALSMFVSQFVRIGEKTEQLDLEFILWVTPTTTDLRLPSTQH